MRTATRKKTVSRGGKPASFEAFLESAGLTMVFQPIVSLRSRRLEGVEALSRFSEGSPADVWARAESSGFRMQLEIECVRAALLNLPALPDRIYLSVNVSPSTVVSCEFEAALEDTDMRRIVLEVTEQAQVDDYDALRTALDTFIARGARLALDDVGSGFTGIAHILRLSPHMIKLDLSVTQNMMSDPWKRALASSLADFGAATKCKIVAEGIETKEEMKLLREIGILHGQGYLLGRPGPVGDLPRRARAYVKDSMIDLAMNWKRVLRRRLVTIPAAAFLLASMIGPAATAFAENAQPGDALWKAKLQIEDFRLAIEDSDAKRVALSMEFASRRVGELSVLMLVEPDVRGTPVVAENFAVHIKETVARIERLNSDQSASGRLVADEIERHQKVLASLATRVCDSPSEQSEACRALRAAHGSTEEALLRLEKSEQGNPLPSPAPQADDQPTPRSHAEQANPPAFTPAPSATQMPANPQPGKGRAKVVNEAKPNLP